MTYSNYVIFLMIGFSIGVTGLGIFVADPLADDLRFLLKNMDCEEILKYGFEFSSGIPESVYENGVCLR